MAVFSDRREAGRVLAEGVREWLHAHAADATPLVLGLARGGVPVAAEVARAVGGELGVAVARKIGMPGQPEFGIGAVTATGEPVWDAGSLSAAGLTEAGLAEQVHAERDEARRRQERYRPGPAPPVAGRVVVVVDDGLATGVTARAALTALHAERPSSLVFAAPVCAAQAATALGSQVDAVVCAERPVFFRAVGAWYDAFPQLTDDDVVRILAGERDRPGPEPNGGGTAAS